MGIPDEADSLDEALCLFVDSLWEYGDPKSYGVEAIVGLGKLIPKCRHMYPCARALLKTWQKHEMPVRCPPLTSDLVSSMVGVCIDVLKDFKLGCLFLLLFHGLLRVSEGLLRKASDFVTTTSALYIWGSPKAANAVEKLRALF